ncbi:GNAT family N-acetyltransferase [Microlunatus parietis]|uniref:GNAT family N-acetyltransferase n=1 Tax=Microlunatus parietis TaxID=682979 RepID=UPI0015CB37B4|nr:GNAT family N-acetyltransferase [Microlunatus parietis]
MSRAEPQLRLVDLGTGSPDAVALAALIDELEQRRWVEMTAAWHLESRVLGAFDEDGTAVGLLRYVIQPIGPENDCQQSIIDGEALTEAKILAFGTRPDRRRQGIGLALQRRAIADAAAAGCWQVRSHSAGGYRANHRLKFRLGFAFHPEVRGGDDRGGYFILPLRNQFRRVSE